MRTGLKLFLSIWLVYALYVTPAGGVTPNRYVDLVHSIVNEGRFAIDTYHDNTIDKAYYNGHYYAGALPGPAFVAVPAYIAFKGAYSLLPDSFKRLAGGIQSFKKDSKADTTFYGTVDNVEYFLSQAFLVAFVVAVFSALGSVIFFKILGCLNTERPVALLLTISYAFGTIVFWNSTTFFEQVFTIFFALASFYTLLKIETQKPEAWKVALAGLLAGCAVLVEFSGGLAVIALFVYAMLRLRKRVVVWYWLGFAAPFLILLWYDFVLFQNPFSTPYQHLAGGGYEGVMGEGFGGITYPHLDRIVGLLLSPERGILVFAPIVILGLAGLTLPGQRRNEFRNEALFFALATALALGFTSSFRGWNAGNGFGPRYLSFGIPFMLLPACFILSRSNLMVGLSVTVVSVLINWAGAQYGFAPTYYEHLNHLLISGPSTPIFEAIRTHAASSNPALIWLKEQRALLSGFLILATLGVLALVWTGGFVSWRPFRKQNQPWATE